MTTVEAVTFDPDAQRGPGQRLGDERFPIVDRGARAVFLILFVLFVVPLVVFERSNYVTTLVGTGFELRVALSVAGLALLLPLVQIFMHIRRFGGSVIRANREAYPVAEGAAGRIVRAHTNLLESIVPFTIAVATTQFLHVSTRWTVAAAGVFLAARLVHAVTYTLGITVIRSAAFYGGVVATVVLIVHSLVP